MLMFSLCFASICTVLAFFTLVYIVISRVLFCPTLFYFRRRRRRPTKAELWPNQRNFHRYFWINCVNKEMSSMTFGKTLNVNRSGQKSSCGSGSWGYPGEGSGGKGKKLIFFLSFFTFQMILNNGCLKSEPKK